MNRILKFFGFVIVGVIVLVIGSKLRNSYRNRFQDVTGVPISLPYSFKSKEAERLSIQAFDLKKSEQYDMAIDLYRQAIKIEPDNPRLYFDLSSCYASINRLEQTILLLDTAIMLDSSYAGFYNNRGLAYYKLFNDQSAIKDFKYAIRLDTSNWVIFANLALALKSNNDQEEACKALRIAIRLGLDLGDKSNQEDLLALESLCKDYSPQQQLKNMLGEVGN